MPTLFTPQTVLHKSLPVQQVAQHGKLPSVQGIIAVAIIPASKAYKAVKALGGMRETARLLVGAGNAKDFIKITGGLGAQIVGIDGVMTNCTF